MSYAFLSTSQYLAVSKIPVKVKVLRMLSTSTPTCSYVSPFNSSSQHKMSSTGSGGNTEESDSSALIERLTSNPETMKSLTQAMMPALLEGLSQVDRSCPGVVSGNQVRPVDPLGNQANHTPESQQ